MTIGPVFVIHGGTVQERATEKDNLVNQWQDQYPFLTETCDVPRDNLVVVFSTNSRDAWAVDCRTVSKNYQPASGGGMRVEQAEAQIYDGNCKKPSPSITDAQANLSGVELPLTFGMSRYP